MAPAHDFLPDLTDRTIVITGTTSGLGLALSAALAGAGARVLMTVRDADRGAAAVARVRAGLDGRGSAEAVLLDLADLASVRTAADDVRERTEDRVDVLINNAAVSLGPREQTRDGFELQIGTNHLGPAALTWLLMPALRAAGRAESPARVVTTSSLGHRTGRLDLADLHWERRRYSPTLAYGASKLANLLFAAELDRRSRRAGDPVLSVAAHPGLTTSELLNNGLARGGGLRARLYVIPDRLLSQPVAVGIRPQLLAAVGRVRGGDYVGPTRLFETRGPAGLARRSAAARDSVLADGLWESTAALTGVTPDPG
ncbi:NAD(P)-dependent dehydrogenase (short-subunit alcohol dehydrogenase family) [Actinoalloteichus hoggarensis]|uniref:Rhamnolipids biosynthesis 3-oxoacyl-[acyl-carrier-protein] reductase n=1 Tax=Actinoalloteichus hoggarensis TaxID=1470176 RepID=A0A221W452_9PSEU|nr:SDR family NAD(P)-dependent oxidoreductase [Actinoalloteichus hoggarensis]ASO20598.1 Rhamnolipids biosynthesis 3-oxoacyl-[acyl-carrier-protein] reductase [Actinoalloteichus hoggarensis]MBB5923639.1 NAD(P)-dependent dehydrogenase (short-subunit alcohol dehydrogenase family) [Actinoalloteichus hoggarensis]